MNTNSTLLTSYVLRGCGNTSPQYVLESRSRVATLDGYEMWWRLHYKSRKAQARPLSDWEYDELRAAGIGVDSEAAAARWVAGGRL